MKEADQHIDIKKLSFAGLLVTLGIVYGDLGTSPLYTIRAIVGNAKEFNELLVYGALSCVFWTLTIQTTIKYIVITLQADNKGEGGIFALFALIRNKTTWAAILAMIGGGALLADGVITPAITVTSSIEGLKTYKSGNFCHSNCADNICRTFFYATIRNQFCRNLIWPDNGFMVSDDWSGGLFTTDSLPSYPPGC